MMKEIHQYINGKLTVQQAYQLWVKAIESPEYLTYLQARLELIALTRPDPQKPESSKKRSRNKANLHD